MRIVIDGRQIADHFPGIGRYVYGLLRGLCAIDHGHAITVLHNPGAVNTRHDLGALEDGERLRLMPTPARPFSLAGQALLPALLLALRAERFHAPYYVMPYMPLPCQAVLTVYDIIPRLFGGEVPLRARLLFDALHRLALRRARRVIAISAATRDDICAAYGFDPARVTTIPLASETEALSPRAPRAARYGLCVSSNKPHKNLTGLVRAWQLLGRDLPLVIAGQWDTRYDEARALAASGSATIRFAHGVSEAELSRLYTGAEVFVFPSRYEGFGLPVLEALSHGVPTICGHHSSLPEVAGDAALYANVNDPDALAAAIGRVLDDAPLRLRLRAAGHARAARFSWRATAEQTLRVYEEG